ncbi:hypothetical protein IFT73_04155 [Aeromicrobium sp. CFBP 8757]|uniref:thrombospondin type 3 repeat-containing protein n=1 Tax=Aeromicrobium sp. CFBP 8757 TaxID=2775288 RepID=UPI00177F977B|nr:thrombospondin type 3 repeat-containing protein [Aeromicrobium sp. CFBP 8757]MBD8606037.1 hypothetical protein [Aeromicrobium sp. CFBP 8757]
MTSRRTTRWLLTALVVAVVISASLTLGARQVHSAYAWATGAEASATDLDADTDHDGLLTKVELAGFATASGTTYVSDPHVADSDGDGLTDGEEAGAQITTNAAGPIYRGISDPSSKDSEGDGVGDADEYFLGTDPWSKDTDGDGLPDEDELNFGSDPLTKNPDDDAFSDMEERDRGSAPLTYDESGWRAHVGTASLVLKKALSVADTMSGGGKLKAASKAVDLAKAAGIAAPVIWNALRHLNLSGIDDELRDKLFGDDMSKLGATLDGGDRAYVAYVGREPGGDVAFVGVTNDFADLKADYGGLNALETVGGSKPMSLGRARAIAEAVIHETYDRMDDNAMANTRHVIDRANHLYAPALAWGREQIGRERVDR